MQVDIIEWLGQNKTWVFSGIGVLALAVAGGIIRRFLHRPSATRQQTQQAGASSASFQAGRDIHVTIAPELAKSVAAIPSKSDSSNMAQAGQRAWISVAEVKAITRSVPPTPICYVDVVLTMRNGGNSPALEFVASHWLELLERAPVGIPTAALDTASAGVVGPHETLQMRHRYERLTSEQRRAMASGTKILLLYGICRYKDIFAATHHTRWCYRYISDTQQFATYISDFNTMD